MNLSTFKSNFKNYALSPFPYLIKESNDGIIDVLLEELYLKLEKADIKITENQQFGLIEHLTWDSNFFGSKIGKLHLFNCQKNFQLNNLIGQAQQKQYTYLFLEIESELTDTISLIQDHGFKLIETRMTYFRSLSDFQPKERYRHVPF